MVLFSKYSPECISKVKIRNDNTKFQGNAKTYKVFGNLIGLARCDDKFKIIFLYNPLNKYELKNILTKYPPTLGFRYICMLKIMNYELRIG